MRTLFIALTAAAAIAVLPLACSEDAASTSSSSGATATSAAGTGGAGGETNAGGAGGTGGSLPAPSAACDALGLPSIPFVEAPSDSALYAVASDVTIPTQAGDYVLSANWSGCDSYLFIQDKPSQTTGWPTPLWDRDVDKLFAALPPNTQIFFVSTSSSETTRADALVGLQDEVAQAFAKLSAEDVAHWTERIHYIPERARDLPGWLGEVMKSPGWGVAIDRAQRIRYIGSYADSKRYDSSKGWFAPNLSMAANEAVYYNFEADREVKLAAENATIVPIFAGEAVAGTVSVEITLPDVATMAGFDTMEIDLYQGCVGDGEYGDCPAWDYIAAMWLCDEADPTVCPVELGRWITTYHREGRWVHDISNILPLLKSGGKRTLSFNGGNTYETKASLRLFASGKAERPVESTPLWTGSPNFDEVYNDAFDPVVVNIPADAKKVEIASVISGHGMSQPGNCAEFCNTTHTFFVNGTENMRDFPQTADSLGCMAQVAQGTVPNQYGTWWYGRGGWCPGKEVPVVMMDVTSQVVVGADNTFDYEGYYKGLPYSGDNWRYIDLSAWVVVSK